MSGDDNSDEHYFTSETQRDPVGYMALSGTRRRGGKVSKTVTIPLGATAFRELMVFIRQQPIDLLGGGPTALAATETICFQADCRYTEVRLLITNQISAQIKVTFSLRVGGAAVAAKYQLYNNVIIPPGGIVELRDLGLGVNDILSGLGNVSPGANVFIFGRKVTTQ